MPLQDLLTMSARTAYHRLLLRTTRAAMASLVALGLAESIAYSPRYADSVPFGIVLISAGGTLWVWSLAWAVAAAWAMSTLIRGKGAGEVGIGALCAAFAFGFWLGFFESLLGEGPVSRDYLGGVVYTTLAVLLFAGRRLTRGLLILSLFLPEDQPHTDPAPVS